MCDEALLDMRREDLPRMRDLAEAQRSFELRKVFAPSRNDQGEAVVNDEWTADGALDAYAEAVLWRLGVVHCMVSFVDRGHQFFIAGALRKTSSNKHEPDDDDDGIVSQQLWFGCSTVPTPGGLCENTLALDDPNDDYPCFMVDDLNKDPRFADLAVVDGRIASYRFYAGVPITTEHGFNIGSFFLFDDKPRDGLSRGQRKFLHQQAKNVMRYMLMKREAVERRRAALMSDGIAKFLDQSAHYRDTANIHEAERVENVLVEYELNTGSDDDSSSPTVTTKPHVPQSSQKPSILEQIQSTLNEAARILRESMEITRGGVVFLHTALANSDVEKFAAENKDMMGEQNRPAAAARPVSPSRTASRRRSSPDPASLGSHLSQGITRSARDKHSVPKVIASSIPDPALWNPTATALNPKTLATLISNYTKGNLWTVDEDGLFSSWRQLNQWEKGGFYKAAERRGTLPSADVDQGRLEAYILSQTFPKAKQIIFLPLWDAAGNRWYSGCFIWTQSSIPVFTVESELTYLSAFTNSMMVEISRLDAVTANKMKSDFIGSISHEFRSPLHGILVSAEFLRDSSLDSSQSELVATIQNCSGTLLDTINHVLDYSKINSFEITSNQEGSINNQLFQVNNLALLCESVIDGMVTANSFRTPLDGGPLSSLSETQSLDNRRVSSAGSSSHEIILNIEQRDWNYRVESGALQRVIMNLLGNAQKFTTSGFILVQLRVVEGNTSSGEGTPQSMLSLRIKDSGRGMSTEFMQRKLYQPFAQEDSFVPGVGLGLSIVWSIVNQLKGKIKVRSELGKGTDVEVTIPIEKAQEPLTAQNLSGELLNLADNGSLMAKIRERATGMSVWFSCKESVSRQCHKDILWSCLRKYFTEWFGFEIREENPTIVVTDRHSYERSASGQRTLLVLEDSDSDQRSVTIGANVAALYSPAGPFKLARALMGLLDQELTFDIASAGTGRGTSDVATQTPLGSPEERTLLSGMIMTDYGFVTPATSYTSSKPAQTPAGVLTTAEAAEDDPTKVSLPAATRMTLTLPVRKPVGQKDAAVPSNIGQAAHLPPQDLPQAIPLPSSPTTTLFPNEPTHARGTSKSLKPSLRVLAVDDNNLNLQLLHRFLLKRKQDVVVTAMNGVKALEVVKKTEQPFDVVFMDISMPEMDGFEATRLIRSFERLCSGVGEVDVAATGTLVASTTGQANPPNDTIVVDVSEGADKEEQTQATESIKRTDKSARAYIVALTGLASQRDRNKAEQCGFDDFLTKPVSFKRIGELLDRLSLEK